MKVKQDEGTCEVSLVGHQCYGGGTTSLENRDSKVPDVL